MNPYHDERGRFCSPNRFVCLPFSFEKFDIDPPSRNTGQRERDVQRITKELKTNKKFLKKVEKTRSRIRNFYADDLEAGAELIEYLDMKNKEIRFGIANFNSLARQTLANGGASFDTSTVSQPKDGFMVSNPENSVIVDSDCPEEVLSELLRLYISDFKEKLTLPHQHIGTWYDSGDKQLFIDVSEQIPDEKTARKAGKDRNEKAIYDIVKGEEIKMGGTGTVNEELNKRYTEHARKLVEKLSLRKNKREPRRSSIKIP